MTPAEVGVIVDAKRPKIVDGVHENDYDRIMERREKLLNEGVNVL